MLSLLGPLERRGRKWSRRAFLQAGALGAGGLTLTQLLRAEALAGTGSSRKAVIQIHLDGGPPHLDMIDLKPEAPAEIRGEFQGIDTVLPGFQVCELLPKLAATADRYAFVRSLVGAAGAHDAFQCQSGFPAADLQSIGGRPALGCVVNKLQGSTADVAPSFVDLMQGRPLVRNSARPGFLGPSYQAFRPDISAEFSRPLEDAMKLELAAKGGNHTTALTLNEELPVDRMHDRTSLLAGLDRIRREVDASGMMDAMDGFTQQAVGILTSGRFAEAMDWRREPAAVQQRYTLASREFDEGERTSEGAHSLKKLLLARRLVEAGVRCVSVSMSDYDTHGDNFHRLRRLLALLDHGLHALTTDLMERGLIDDVSIVVWGEFGRTPKINKGAGRDHWPNVGMVMFAGGGMRTGQVIGATDRYAQAAVARPVHYQDVLATLYRNLGIDLASARLIDPSGRPQFLLDQGQPIAELT